VPQNGSVETSAPAHAAMMRPRTLALCIACAICAAGIPFLGRDQLHIALPAMAVALIAWTFLLALWSGEDAMPLEIGTVYCAAISVYALVPLLGYLFSGLEFSPLSDSRLVNYSPSPREVGAFGWKYVLYLSGFAAVYAMGRGDASPARLQHDPPDRVTLRTIVLLFLSLALFFAILFLAGGVSYSWSYESAAEAIAAMQRLPLWLRQISTHLNGMFFTVKLCLLVALFAHYGRSRGAGILLFIWLSAEVLLSVFRLGARTEPVLLLMGAALLYHWKIRPIKAAYIFTMAAVLLLGYLVYGVVRDLQLAIQEAGASPLSTTNEFQSVFATAYDLAQRRAARSLRIPWSLHFSDLISLVPSYLLPFAKSSSAEWYLDVIGERGAGVGFTFGAISESIVGFGDAELLLRAGAVGAFFALIHRWYARRQSEFWVLLLYVWACVWCYQSFRNTSFYLLFLFQYHVLPVILLAGAVRYLIREPVAGQGAA
jgi:hypothetical protein